MRGAVAIFTLVVALAAPSVAQGLPVNPPSPTPAVPAAPAPVVAPPVVAPTPAAPATDPPGNAGFGTNGGILGTPGILDQPDITCRQLIPGTSPEVVRNCAVDNQPRSAFPAGNYGLDIHIDTGLTSPGADIADVFQTIIDAIFSGFVALVGALLSFLGWVFNFDIFRDGLKTINQALARELGGLTVPLLPLAFVILGGFLMVRWWRADASGMISHALLACALMLAGFALADNPGAILSPIDNFTNSLAGAAIGLTSGNGRANGYADSEPALWNVAVEQPWCELEFGSITWCAAPVDPAMDAARKDIAANHLPEALGNQGTDADAKAEAPHERARLNAARTNGQVFLSFLPNSDARNGKNADWSLYNVLDKERPDLLSIRGPGGFVQRGIALMFGAIVGVTFLLLIGYIALQLVVNNFAIAGCLLAAPLVPLVAVSPSGQKGVKRWLGWLFGAFARKVIYATYLGLVILMAGIVGAVGQSAGFVVYWFLLAVLFGAALVFRHKPIELVGMGVHPVEWPLRMRRERHSRPVSNTTMAENNTYQSLHVHPPATNGHNPTRVPNIAGDIQGRSRELGP